MELAFRFGRILGQLLFLLSNLFWFVVRWLRQFFIDLWHGSVKWGWFAVLLVGAMAFASVDEFAGAYGVAALAVVSAVSNIWHWAAQRPLGKRLRFLVFPLLVFFLILLFFEAAEIKGSKKWSHVPEAWNRMLIASALRMETMSPVRAWPPIEIPNPSYTPLTRQISQWHPNEVTLASVTLSGTIRAGERITTNFNLKGSGELPFQIRVWTLAAFAAVSPFDSNKQKAIEGSLWPLEDGNKNPSLYTFNPGLPQTMTVTSDPFTQQEVDFMNSGTYGAYFFLVVQDAKTNRTFLEMCTYDTLTRVNAECEARTKPHPK